MQFIMLKFGIMLIFQSILILVSSFEIIDVLQRRDTECYGTSNGLSFSVNHYERMRLRYRNCTYVIGNLEITHLNSANITYDLSFLRNIRVVTGYVLIGYLYEEQIPLLNLRLIRGDNTFFMKGDNYGLVVVVTTPPPEKCDSKSGLQELQMPSLREISNGKVLFLQNHKLKFVDTIQWETILPEIENPVLFPENSVFLGASNCSEVCEVDGVRRCWGQGDNMCQEVQFHTRECHPSCPGRCYDEGIQGCCHPECAVGCWGPSDYDCQMCKYFRDDNRCLSTCPEQSYSIGVDCIHF